MSSNGRAAPISNVPYTLDERSLALSLAIHVKPETRGLLTYRVVKNIMAVEFRKDLETGFPLFDDAVKCCEREAHPGQSFGIGNNTEWLQRAKSMIRYRRDPLLVYMDQAYATGESVSIEELVNPPPTTPAELEAMRSFGSTACRW